MLSNAYNSNNTTVGSNNTEAYWAGADAKELSATLEDKIDSYYMLINGNGRRALWAQAYTQYNQAIWNGGQINYAGAQMEYSLVNANLTRRVIKQYINQVINQRPSFEPKATNTDAKSQKQTVIAKSLLEYYSREKHLEAIIYTAVENATLYGEGYVVASWDQNAGRLVDAPPSASEAPVAEEAEVADIEGEEAPVEAAAEVQKDSKKAEGDLFYEAFEPMDVVRDVGLNSARSSIWYATKIFRNRWDLVARFPQHKDAIMAMPTLRDPLRNFTTSIDVVAGDTDIIEAWEFYHDRTPALPDGRYCLFLYGNGPLLTGPLPYKAMPVRRMACDDITGESFGYGVIYDMLNIAQAIDAAYSAIQTSQKTFGVQSIAVPKGSNLTSEQLTDGLNLVEYDAGPGGGKPEVLQLLQTPAEMFNHLQTLESLLTRLGSQNEVTMGYSPDAGMSGAALALLQSQVIKALEAATASYVRLVEDLATNTVSVLRDYSWTTREVAIVGISNRSNLQEFTSEDLSDINRVMVDIGTPLMRTTAGKMAVAQDLLKAQKADGTPAIDAVQYMQILATGNLETITEGIQQEAMNIKSENEFMTDGKEVPVLVTDNHRAHMKAHTFLLADPAVRTDPQRLEIVSAHIQAHFQMLSNPENAGILMAMGQEPAQNPMAQQDAALAGVTAPGGQPSNPGTPAAGAIQGGAADVPMPNLPSLPAGATPVDGATVTA